MRPVESLDELSGAPLSQIGGDGPERGNLGIGRKGGETDEAGDVIVPVGRGLGP